MKRILVLNNYSFQRVEKEVEQSKKPSHHSYGVDVLKKLGYQIILVEPSYKSILSKIGKKIALIPFLNFGDWFVQYKAISFYKKYDIVYAASQDVTTILGFLRYIKLFNKPIITLVHHPLLKGKLAWFRRFSLFCSLKGHSAFFTLSGKVADEINLITRTNTARLIHWGPDVKYYHKIQNSLGSTEKDIDIIAIGRTGRDYKTLINAFNDTNIRLVIVCAKSLENQLPKLYSNNINILYQEHDEALSYPEIIEMYQRAKILAIPLVDENSLAGLTSITDGLAVNMPMLVTRNKYVEIDIEKFGIGYWIEAFDSDAWLEKSKLLLGSLSSFKKENFEIAVQKFNYEIFSAEVQYLIDQCS